MRISNSSSVNFWSIPYRRLPWTMPAILNVCSIGAAACGTIRVLIASSASGRNVGSASFGNHTFRSSRSPAHFAPTELHFCRRQLNKMKLMCAWGRKNNHCLQFALFGHNNCLWSTEERVQFVCSCLRSNAFGVRFFWSCLKKCL